MFKLIRAFFIRWFEQRYNEFEFGFSVRALRGGYVGVAIQLKRPAGYPRRPSPEHLNKIVLTVKDLIQDVLIERDTSFPTTTVETVSPYLPIGQIKVHIYNDYQAMRVLQERSDVPNAIRDKIIA